MPRHDDDPAPGGPLPFDFLNQQWQPEERLQADVLALRSLVADDQRGDDFDGDEAAVSLTGG